MDEMVMAILQGNLCGGEQKSFGVEEAFPLVARSPNSQISTRRRRQGAWNRRLEGRRRAA
jgi:hypothetical protein